MAAFSYQHPTFVFDSFLVPDIPDDMSGFPQQATIVTTEPCFPPMLRAGANECSQEIPLLAQIYETSPPHKISGGTGKQDTNSSTKAATMAGGDQLVAQTESATEKKRKNGDVKVGRERTGEKERKNNGVVVGKAEERRTKPCAKKQKKMAEETPSDYVRVRARRGQATDSHSLAERVRRAKISARMKLLQSLVPGCDKMTGKAQILDEIIKHVQTIQTQVEFLAAKLASVTSMFNDFEVDFDINPLAQESLNFHKLPTVLETSSTCGRIQSLNFHQFPEKTPNPDPTLLNQEQRSICNDNGNFLWETDQSPREELANEYAWI